MTLQKDDRIELIRMDNDPTPVPVGTKGTVTYVTDLGRGETQVGVKWDNGRSLSLILPHDEAVKI